MPSFSQLLGRHLQRVLAFLHQAALHAVGDVGELHAAVADAASRRCACSTCGAARATSGVTGDGVALQQALVAVPVADDLDLGRQLGVALDQAADGRGQAGREAAGGEHGDFVNHALQPKRAECSDQIPLIDRTAPDTVRRFQSPAGLVLGIGQTAPLQTEAAATDAAVQPIPQPLETLDLLVQPGPPAPGQPRPVGLGRRPALGQCRQRNGDLIEAQSHPLRRSDEGQPA